MHKPINLALFLAMALTLMSAPLVYHYAKGNLSAAPLPPKSHTDAVIVFTGSADRTVKGYQFYLMGWAKKLMITGDDYAHESKVPKVRRLSKRADKDDVTIDLKATNTIENAQNSADWALKTKVKSILLITTEGHMARAYFELRRLLPEDIKIFTQPVPGKVRHAGLDSEKGRLLCRLYETATGTSFCYQTRTMVQGIENQLEIPDVTNLPDITKTPPAALRLQTKLLTDLSAAVI